MYLKAYKHLSKAEPKFKHVIKKTKLKVPSGRGVKGFEGYERFLIRSIIYQQISGKAGDAISKKFLSLFRGKQIDFKKILKFSDAQFQSAGVSPQKRKYIRDLARHVENDLLPPEEKLKKLEDQIIIETVTQVKGIGVWTAQMLLIFYLKRPDVFPALDLGVKKGYQKTFGGKVLPNEETMLKRSEKWKPFRSLAAIYLWHMVDNG